MSQQNPDLRHLTVILLQSQTYFELFLEQSSISCMPEVVMVGVASNVYSSL